MVFTTVTSLVRAKGPDSFWRKRKIFKLAAVRVISNYIFPKKYNFCLNFALDNPK